MPTYQELMEDIADDLKKPENNVVICVPENLKPLSDITREAVQLYTDQYIKFFKSITNQLIEKNAIGKNPETFVSEATTLAIGTMKQYLNRP